MRPRGLGDPGAESRLHQQQRIRLWRGPGRPSAAVAVSRHDSGVGVCGDEPSHPLRQDLTQPQPGDEYRELQRGGKPGRVAGRHRPLRAGMRTAGATHRRRLPVGEYGDRFQKYMEELLNQYADNDAERRVQLAYFGSRFRENFYTQCGSGGDPNTPEGKLCGMIAPLRAQTRWTGFPTMPLATPMSANTKPPPARVSRPARVVERCRQRLARATDRSGWGIAQEPIHGPEPRHLSGRGLAAERALHPDRQSNARHPGCTGCGGATDAVIQQAHPAGRQDAGNHHGKPAAGRRLVRLLRCRASSGRQRRRLQGGDLLDEARSSLLQPFC